MYSLVVALIISLESQVKINFINIPCNHCMNNVFPSCSFNDSPLLECVFSVWISLESFWNQPSPLPMFTSCGFYKATQQFIRTYVKEIRNYRQQLINIYWWFIDNYCQVVKSLLKYVSQLSKNNHINIQQCSLCQHYVRVNI